MTEEWRPTHHPNYDVSSWGRVMSRAQRKPKILKWQFPSHGYPTVSLGKGKQFLVHRLVAAAFLGPCPSGQEVCHRDDNPRNPALSNLEYGTRKDNIAGSVARGRFANSHAHVPRVNGKFVAELRP